MAATRYVTPEEYAVLKRLSKGTVYRHLRRGLIPGAEQVVKHGSYRIPVPAALVPEESAA